MRRGEAISVLLAAGGAGFALLGLFYFVLKPVYVWDGALFCCVALFLIGLWFWRRRGAREGSARTLLSELRASPLRTAVGAGGVLLVLLAGVLARYRAEYADFSALFCTWLIGMVLFLSAFLPAYSPRETWRRAKRRLWRHRVELAGLVVLAGVSLAVRAYNLEHIPANLGGDEGIWGLEGLAMLDGRLANPFATRWFAFPSMSFLAWGLGMRLFGQTVAGLRTLSALVGAASVVTSFFLFRELWGRRIASIGAVLLAFSHYHIHYSRLAYNNIADDVFVTLALWLLVRGLRSGREVSFALSGAVIGLGWYGYFGARLIGILAALVLIGHMAVDRRFLSRHGRSLLVLLGAALLAAAPLLFYYAAYPDALNARSSQVSIFASGWLEREQVITGRSAASLLLEQAWKSISAFNYTLDPTFIYRPGAPLLDLLSGTWFIFGLVWAAAHARRMENATLLLWFWLSVILGWVVTENPPASQRIIIVAPALAALAGLGLSWGVGLCRQVFGGRREWWDRAVVLLIAVVILVNLHFYFDTYTPARVYGNPTAEIATDLSRYLQGQQDDAIVHFYAPPVMYWDFGTLAFMARGVEGWNVFPPGEGSVPPPLDPARGARFVFLLHRLEEMEGIVAQHPGGSTREVLSTADGRLLYVLYEVLPR